MGGRAGCTKTQGVSGRESDSMIVTVTRVSLTRRLDESLRDRRDHRRTATKLDWTKIRFRRKDAYLDLGRSLNYVTQDKIPTMTYIYVCVCIRALAGWYGDIS